MSWLAQVCSQHELLEPSAPQQEKSIDVGFISISRSVCELQKVEGVSSECEGSRVLLGFFQVVEQNLDCLVHHLDTSGMQLCTTWVAMVKDALQAPGRAVYCCGICSSMAVASGGATALPILYDDNDIHNVLLRKES